MDTLTGFLRIRSAMENDRLPTDKVSAENNLPGSSFADHMSHNADYERRTGHSVARSFPKEPTRTYAALNPLLWRDQDWESIEMMDDTRKMWSQDPFDASEFDYRYMKPKEQALCTNPQHVWGKGF